jgi:hypothetical protein
METQMMVYSEKADSTDIRLILSRYLEPLMLRGLMEPISRTIVNLPQLLSELSKPDRALIDKLFDIKASLGRLIYPEIVKGYGPRDLVKDQKIIKVTNKVTYEEALFNDLRSRRPFQARESIDVVKEIKNTED